MSRTLIDNVQALDPGRGRVASSIMIDDGRIVSFDPGKSRSRAEAVTIDGGGRLLTPGLIDLHTHGVGRFFYEKSPEELVEGLKFVTRFGVTGVLPTLYRVMVREKLDHLAALARALRTVDTVHAPGFHLEGPFLALPGAGADTMDGDVALLDDIFAATTVDGKHGVAAMSISPDTPNIIPVIERLVERGVVVFITHTRATVEQTQRALDAGARHATHFYDVFPLPDAREPGARPCGAVEAILADPRASVDFICDGVHVEPVAVAAALRAKGWRNTILITDSNVGAGLEPGVYDLPWGFSIRVSPGDAARMHDPGGPRDGTLAGSALTMNRGIDNLLNWLDLDEAEVWAMGSRSPARRMGWKKRGRIKPGAIADLVLWDRDEDGALTAAQTWVNGRCVYERSREGVMS